LLLFLALSLTVTAATANEGSNEKEREKEEGVYMSVSNCGFRMITNNRGIVLRDIKGELGISRYITNTHDEVIPVVELEGTDDSGIRFSFASLEFLSGILLVYASTHTTTLYSIESSTQSGDSLGSKINIGNKDSIVESGLRGVSSFGNGPRDGIGTVANRDERNEIGSIWIFS